VIGWLMPVVLEVAPPGVGLGLADRLGVGGTAPGIGEGEPISLGLAEASGLGRPTACLANSCNEPVLMACYASRETRLAPNS
jgi:hypothetical protein